MWDGATPATWNEGGCHQCHACHAKCRGLTRARHPVPWVPRLPRKTKVNVRRCDACQVKRRWMSSSAMPATQSAAASCATKSGPSTPPSAMRARLPRKTKVNVRWCHACHVKRRWCHQVPRLPRKVPRRHARLKGAQVRHPVPWAPGLPRKTKVNVRRCHACHVKRRWLSSSATPATQSAAASRATKSGPSAPPSAMSATPATQNQGGCHQVPRLPRKTKVDVTKCHACHAKRK